MMLVQPKNDNAAKQSKTEESIKLSEKDFFLVCKRTSFLDRLFICWTAMSLCCLLLAVIARKIYLERLAS